MRIISLALRHFRNFQEVEEIIFPPQGLLVVAAPNAVGKTNFLESIYFLLRGKSFRAQAGECVQWGADSFAVQATVETASGRSRLSARYDRQQKILALKENTAPASLTTFYARYPFVLFLPEDTFMFARGPAARRNFLNTALAVAPAYLAALVQYHRVLRQRNAALKQARAVGEIAAWNTLLAEHAASVWEQRQMFTQFLVTHVPLVYTRLGGAGADLEIRLVPGASETKNFRQILGAAFPQESRYAYTLYGPHRDDLAIWQGGHQVQTGLSRGQMRLLVIALKVVTTMYMKQITGQEPVLLLDEVLSELDDERQHMLLEHLPAVQTILTCTTLPAQLASRAGVQMMDLRALLQPAAVVAGEPVPMPG